MSEVLRRNLKKPLMAPLQLSGYFALHDMGPGREPVLAGFAVLYLKQPLGWNHGLRFALIALGSFFIFTNGRRAR